MSELTEWSNFYVIVGSAGGALIGLQFVVMTLIAQRPPLRGAEAGAAFATPNIIHFGAVLLLSAIDSVPWHGSGNVSLVWGVVGLSGVAYTVVVARRLRTQKVYRPVFEDWLFHMLLPLAAYVLLGGAALTAHSYAREALILVGAATLLLLFVGIHNAWDATMYHVFTYRPESERDT